MNSHRVVLPGEEIATAGSQDVQRVEDPVTSQLHILH